MRNSIIAIVALGSLASAQNFAGEPSCAIPCLTSAISVAGCQPNDEGCQCGSGFSSIQNVVATCLLSACNQSDLQRAASVGLGLCSAYSASLASASAVTTASSSHSSSAAVVTTSSTIPVSTTSVTAVTTSVPATTSAPSTSGSKSSSASAASSSGSSSSVASVSKNAAPTIVAGLGGLMGVAAAFVAAL